ncbi:MAG: putative N-acetylmannosamine-6-phosphate 2-epimerase [Clostridiales bacterium]|nr:putative N-acetylmannosamine-6-phosphate 2-epimerase [Clostridiales bacterium]
MIFPKGLIVSCQALEGNPFRNSELLAVMAKAAELGGAKAIRANGVDDIQAIRRQVTIPIIGINKKKDSNNRTVITPSLDCVKEIIDAGADIIALDATTYPGDIREDPYNMIRQIHDRFGVPVMADISTLHEACLADEAGADAISTTLAGYVPGALHKDSELYKPDLSLLQSILDKKLGCLIVAEGRFWDRTDVAKAFAMGIDAIVIGKAITNPMAITKYFNACIEGENNS